MMSLASTGDFRGTGAALVTWAGEVLGDVFFTRELSYKALM
jgi:hypothetical protein